MTAEFTFTLPPVQNTVLPSALDVNPRREGMVLGGALTLFIPKRQFVTKHAAKVSLFWGIH